MREASFVFVKFVFIRVIRGEIAILTYMPNHDLDAMKRNEDIPRQW